LPSIAAAKDAIGLLVVAEDEIDLGFCCTNVNDIIFRGSATLPPDCPRDRLYSPLPAATVASSALTLLAAFHNAAVVLEAAP
jgi:hypothetical protein